MAFPARALLDPLANGIDLGIGEHNAGLRRRHSRSAVSRADASEQAAFRLIAGRHDLVAAPIGEETLFGIEPQVGQAMLVIGTVAGEAVVGKNRPNVAIEIDGLFGAQAKPGSAHGQNHTKTQTIPP